MKNDDPIVDYAVVGAGVSGAYVAWRLASMFKDRVVRLYEATHRIGGRLLSPKAPDVPGGVAELGGMRFTPEQILVRNLVHSFKLPWKRFEYEMRMSYLRGVHFGPGEKPPYELAPGESGKSPDELVKQAIRCALLEVSLEDLGNDKDMSDLRERVGRLRVGTFELSRLRPVHWRLLKKHGLHGDPRLLRPVPLSDRGFWNILSYYLSPEAFLYVRNALGYESIVANWNAAEAIPWFLRDFAVTEYRTLDAGMAALPLTLAAAFEQRSKEPVYKGRVLTKILRSNAQGLLRLFFDLFDEEGREIGKAQVEARHIVLALPKEPLKRLLRSEDPEMRGFVGTEANNIELALNSVTAHALFKLLLCYGSTWWNDPRALGRSCGRAVTDMPIRQVYYFGDPKPASFGPAVLMASYSDAHFVDFWMPYHRRRSNLTYYYTGQQRQLYETILERFGATDDMVREAHQQVRLIHPKLSSTNGIPVPLAGLVMEWSTHEPVYGRFFGGGWHTWNAHTEPWKVI